MLLQAWVMEMKVLQQVVEMKAFQQVEDMKGDQQNGIIANLWGVAHVMKKHLDQSYEFLM